ncbi:threonylcarbamoyladenosine tRNA methylthiotransferase [Palaeococcus pacificus DY20341]|uniref:tRNA-t(6)A37 methylthiotransferase n=2 Tax=Palaeococcus TaxID=83867 RepID=A0A075LTN2_9EURY|nr:threonylcarbamoyladenosine tRNA methylthiotransferase [Palaeococcus pacificus DY20341]
MEALLLNAGYEISDLDSADYVIVNTCAVKDPTEHHMSRRIKELLDGGKRVIVTGCLPHINPKVIDERVSAILGVKSIDRIGDAIRLAEEGEKLISIEQRSVDKLELPRIWKSSVAFVVPISEGCLNACTYCGTRFARGVLKSYAPEKVVKWVKEALARGYKEIQLSSEDTGCYGFDIGTNLAELLDEITAIEGEFRVRVGMMNPNHVIKFLDELVDVYKDEKIYKFLHLPVQSGDNEILRLMARTYTVEEFEEIVGAFRRKIPGLNLNTDIIVGFPGETEEAFQNTVALIERVRPDKINVSRFSPRPGTLAAKMKNQVVGWRAKERSRYLHRLRLSISYEINKKLVGRELEVLTHGQGQKGGIEGRTMNYKDIILPGAPVGEFVKVKVTKATATYLMGELVE